MNQAQLVPRGGPPKNEKNHRSPLGRLARRVGHAVAGAAGSPVPRTAHRSPVITLTCTCRVTPRTAHRSPVITLTCTCTVTPHCPFAGPCVGPHGHHGAAMSTAAARCFACKASFPGRQRVPASHLALCRADPPAPTRCTECHKVFPWRDRVPAHYCTTSHGEELHDPRWDDLDLAVGDDINLDHLGPIDKAFNVMAKGSTAFGEQRDIPQEPFDILALDFTSQADRGLLPDRLVDFAATILGPREEPPEGVLAAIAHIRANPDPIKVLLPIEGAKFSLEELREAAVLLDKADKEKASVAITNNFVAHSTVRGVGRTVTRVIQEMVDEREDGPARQATAVKCAVRGMGGPGVVEVTEGSFLAQRLDLPKDDFLAQSSFAAAVSMFLGTARGREVIERSGLPSAEETSKAGRGLWEDHLRDKVIPGDHGTRTPPPTESDVSPDDDPALSLGDPRDSALTGTASTAF